MDAFVLFKILRMAIFFLFE
ncbi:hypothetical protein ACNKHR_21605 [Shigella flexneri]